MEKWALKALLAGVLTEAVRTSLPITRLATFLTRRSKSEIAWSMSNCVCAFSDWISAWCITGCSVASASWLLKSSAVVLADMWCTSRVSGKNHPVTWTSFLYFLRTALVIAMLTQDRLSDRDKIDVSVPQLNRHFALLHICLIEKIVSKKRPRPEEPLHCAPT